jgi:hypothetical protein
MNLKDITICICFKYLVEAAGVELTAPTKPEMFDISGFTLDFSQLFNILHQFNKFKKHGLIQL